MEDMIRLCTGCDIFDNHGTKVGTVTDVIFEPTTLLPEWYEVKTGMVGGHHLVPAELVEVEQGHGVMPVEKKTVKSAPGTSMPPSPDEKESLLAHYRAA